MLEDRSFWFSWATFLKKKGAKDLAITLLEGAGPLRILAAQLLYAGMPFVGLSSSPNQMQALADMLDNGQKTASFISFLREEA
jgi:hypothetical protein